MTNMLRRAAGVLLLAMPWAAAPLGAEVEYETFSAPSLDRSVALAVHLPPSYGKGNTRYPVLYVLHGLFESHRFWEGRGLAAILDRLWQTGALPEMIVVAPDGGNSFFVNGRTGRYEDLVTHDVITYVESHYRTVPGREGRALAGVSMGGYAALRLALTHPELYRVVATHSAMVLQKPPTRADGAGSWQMAAFHQVFGEPIDAALWAANDPLALAERADPKSTPALSFDCGAQDRYGLYAGNEELHRRLLARGVGHTFALHPGDHGYEYVRTVLPDSLRFLAAALSGPGGAAARARSPR